MIKAIHLLLADGKSRGMGGIPAKLDKSTGLIGHDPIFIFVKLVCKPPKENSFDHIKRVASGILNACMDPSLNNFFNGL